MPDPGMIDLLELIDREIGEHRAALARLQALRDELAGQAGTIVPVSTPAAATAGTIVPPNLAASLAEISADDFGDGNLIDTTSAAARFGYPRDTIALWCREGCGVKRGGRWLIDPKKLQRRLNGSG